MNRSENKWAIPAVFGGILVVAVAAILIFGDGIGGDDVPEDAVAVVDGTAVSRDDFDRALAQVATQQGLDQPPPADDPQYDALAEQAMNTVLDAVWIKKEGERQGIEVSDREIQEEFEQTKNENFKSEKEYQDFLKQSGFTQEDINERVELQLISTRIQEDVNEGADSVPEDEAEKFYEDNKDQFEQPESRNIRLIQADTEDDAQAAFEALSADNSPESWNKVASKYSTDASSKENGGVRENVTEGVFGDPLGAEVFDAPQGEVQGPVASDDKFYVFQVDQVTEARTIPFDEARTQIDQQLSSQFQQEVFQAFVGDYRDRWTQVTVCAEDVLGERCDNFGGEAVECDLEAQEEQQAQLPEDQRTGVSCPAPVFAAGGGAGPTPAPPGSIQVFAQPSGQPQRPHPPGEDEEAVAPGGLPPGLVPGGAGGAGGAAVQPGG